jgi:HAE1 family hydrophobic/amphiphilic exporter-1
VIFTVLAVLGIFSYNQLKYELLPKMSIPWITIITVYPGASPYEVESSVTKIVEDAVSGIDKVSNVYATSQEGISFVSVELDLTADINGSLQDVQRKMNEIASQFPVDAKTPTISKFALDELPVLRMGVTANMPSREFYQLVKDRLQPRLAKLAGVGQITLVGGDRREIRVNVDAQKLRAYNISLLQLTQYLKSSNFDFPTGSIKKGDDQFVVRLAGKFASVEDLRRLVVGQSRQGGDVRLADIAEVEDGQKDATQYNRIDGKTSVGILVQKQSEANSVDLSKNIRAELPRLEADFKNIGLKFDIAQDGSEFTIDAANAVKGDLRLAVLFVALVMLAFLHSIRNSVIVMIAIPASLVSTFIAMYAFGLTLNLMTLLGMSLVIGILVDDSIVVLENIYRHLEMGDDRATASLRGRNEIGFAALSITLVDIVVFVPLALVTGIVGNIMREFALVVVFSTFMSLFVSFTITPLLASRFAKLERMTRRTILGRFSLWFEKWYDELAKEYGVLLHWGLNNRWKVLAFSGALFVASIGLLAFGFIGNEFMTQVDRGEFTVFLETPPSSTLEYTNTVTRRVEKMIGEFPEVRKTFVNVGVSNEGFVGQSSSNASEISISLVPKNQRSRSTEQITRDIKRRVLEMPGVKVRVNPIGLFGTANQAPIQILVSGPTYDEVRKAASVVGDHVKLVAGTADLRLSSEEGKPETRIDIDREKLAGLGLSMGEVGATLRIAFNGDDESKYREGSTEYPIRIVLDAFDRSQPSDIENLTFLNRSGQMVQLKQFATVTITTGPTKLQRQNRNYSVTVFSQAIGRPAGDIVADIKTELSRAGLPAGINVDYLGDEKNRAESAQSMGLALAAAVLFVYLIMVALYDSFIYPFVVLFSIPVAIIGAFLALALTMKPLTIFSMLGVIMLVGLVGKNAILLVDRANQMKRERKLSTFEALLEAGQTRLRPILMTTMSMIVGMMPIAIGASSGSEWKSGLAWALIGGLASSLLLTLVLVPVVYYKFDQWKETVPVLVKSLLKRRVRREVPGVVTGGAVELSK